MRILTLGVQNAGKSAIVNRLKHNETVETEPTRGFNVTQIEFNSCRFTLWEVGGDEESRNSFRQHTQNTQGIVFVVDGSDKNSFGEAQEQLQQVIKEDSLGGLPLLVYANKVDMGGNLQDVIEEFGLNNITDREWYIQGSEALTGLGVNQGFDWLSKNIISKGNKSYSFEAHPKVVKTQSKYKQSDAEPQSKSQVTFANLMKDQKIIMMNPVQQENEYIKLEKERIKIENMHHQLKNFKKNKNKMTPYEIRPSPNPRIDVNLEFFLTDHNNLIQPQKTSCITQTDEFKERPPTPPYIPKKTGIDVATQVEDFELFDFDREVTPIVNVIVTKTCEQSMLEIEQEEEILKMKQFKREYYERREQDKEKQQMILNKEIEEIKSKNEKLKKYLDQEDMVITTLQRTQAYAIAGQYLKDVQKNSFISLFNNGYYPNNLDIQLKTDFIPWLVNQTCKEINVKKQATQQVVGLFDQDCIPPMLTAKNPIIEEREKKRARLNQRRVNEANEYRYMRIFYNQNNLQQSNFVKDFARFSDGTLEEYRQSYQAKQEELKGKIESGDVPEEDYQKLLQEDFPEQRGWGFQVEKINKLAFTLAHNRYYNTMESQKQLSLQAFCFNSRAEILYNINKENLRPQTDNKQFNKFIRYKTQIRDPKRKIDNDEAIIVDFSKIPEDVSVIFFFTKIPNLVQLAPQQQENLQYVQGGVEDWKYNISVTSYQLSDVAKLEELVKPQEEGQEDQTAYVFSYVLTRKGTNWILEQVNQAKAFYEPSTQKPEEGEENQENNEENNNNNEEQNKQSEFEQYIDSIREFWGIQDGVLKPKQNILKTDQDEIGSQSNIAPADENQGGDSLEGSMVNVPQQPRVTDVFKVELAQEYEKFFEFLDGQLQELDQEFIQSCTNGYDFFFKEKELERMGQVKRIRNVQDLEVKARDPPPPEPEKDEDEEGEEGEEDEDQE